MWEGPAFEVTSPRCGALPLVVASPHSGSLYPADLLQASCLSGQALRRSEDCYVQDLVADATAAGAAVIHALFPRAYVDANREPYELDPLLFDEPLPAYANSRSPRVTAGLGTIARVVASGQPIYWRKLAVREALDRLERCYLPYHRALRDLIEERVSQFGLCILLDCHSMPSLHAAHGGAAAPDVVLGDCHGLSALSGLVEVAQKVFRELGYRVAYNAPYAGGFVTRQYGRPERGVQALQIEMARGLYMNERNLKPNRGYRRLRADLSRVFAGIADWISSDVQLPRAAE
ncbi:MAG: N-formylglutamate amidohydrolase [Rhodospirillales bacterium]|nr:N-formylglutamate amidohydrolase [Rhodospirillales bacterium]